MIKKIFMPSLSENAYVYNKDGSKNAIIIDPGMVNKKLDRYIEEENLKVLGILLTHGHADHMMGAKHYREKYKVDIYAHEEEYDLLNNPEYNFSYMLYKKNMIIEDAVFFKTDETLVFDDISVKCRFTPGHTKGSATFEIEDFIVAGDLIFRLSVGRTDIYTANYNTLENSIRNVIYQYPDETIIYTGHGEKTSVGFEKENNPFIRVK